MPKQIDNEVLLNTQFDTNKYELANNFNSQHCLTQETKLVIIGTITPPAGSGYFYTSPANKIYGYIDDFFNQKTLKTLKKQLFDKNYNKNETIFALKQELISKNIAFLDIMKNAIRKNDSPYDNDILCYSLDIEGFSCIPKNAFVICNSRLAEQGYNQICEILKIQPKYKYLSQRGSTKKEWLDTFANIFNKNKNEHQILEQLKLVKKRHIIVWYVFSFKT